VVPIIRHVATISPFSATGYWRMTTQVAVGDRGPGHRVAPDPEHEQRSVPDQPTGQPEGILGQFHGVRGDPGRDLPDERARTPGTNRTIMRRRQSPGQCAATA
jgi:hypothetical protein